MPDYTRIKERIQQHTANIACITPGDESREDVQVEALLAFIVSELELAEKRGYDSCMNPEREHEEQRILHRILRIVESLAKQKPVSRWLVIVRPLEPITKKDNTMDTLDLGQIPLGMRCPVDYVPDEAVDVKSDGNFASVTPVDGDSTSQVAPGSTATKFRVYFNGDGAVGKKSANVAVDGHVGPDDVEIVQLTTWEVISKDATTFAATKQPLEPIPTA